MNHYLKIVSIALSFVLANMPITSFSQETSPTVFDKEAVAVKRVAPKMPSRAKTSGYCCVSYAVNEKGNAIDIETPYCTDSVFSRPSKKTLANWRFEPATKNGESVEQSGFVSTITYRKADLNGIPIASKSGYLKRLRPEEKLPPRPQDFKSAFRWTETHFDDTNICDDIE